ncbi:hypothetical protein [Robbsia andropogonis]|uniref:hypothetical protein n=1 Tax=Robbsia andropogonis TaxID=28092 RepID=UPI002A6990CB|nr:hypothetical protein [Robbsia andropogonis]
MTDREMLDAEAMPEISKLKTIWIAWTNSDLTEGRGHQLPLAICEKEVSARRLGRKGSVMGSDCHVTKDIALNISGQWYVPGKIIPPSKDDIAAQERIDRRYLAIEKALAAGLTEDDIAEIGRGMG